jgi:hypothetical protein
MTLVRRLTPGVYTRSVRESGHAFPLALPEIIDMLYIEKGIHMRIDAAMPQNQSINQTALPPQKEVAGEREPDGDADDAVKAVAKSPMFQQQIKPQGVGNKVDVFA